MILSKNTSFYFNVLIYNIVTQYFLKKQTSLIVNEKKEYYISFSSDCTNRRGLIFVL